MADPGNFIRNSIVIPQQGCSPEILLAFRRTKKFLKGIAVSWLISPPSDPCYCCILVHLRRMLKCTIVITALSVVRCPSVVNFLIFDFFSEIAERNSTKLYRKQDLNVLYQVCVFQADQKTKMATAASDWLRHFRLLLCNRWTELNETLQEAKSQRPLLSLCFSGRSEKTIWPPRPLIGWDIFDFFSETAEQNSTKLDRKQDLNVFYQVFCFSGLSEKEYGRPVLWLAETFLTSPLKPLNGIQRIRPRVWIGGDKLTVTLDYIVAQQTKSSHWLINI